MKLEYPRILEDISLESGHRPHDVFRSFVRLTACVCASRALTLEITADAIRQNAPGWSRIALIPDREDEFAPEWARYDEKAQKLMGQAFGALVMDAENAGFDDILGSVHMDWMGKSGQSWNGEFHTPMALSSAIARMTMSDLVIPDDGHATICDPAAGSGNLILGAAETLYWKEIPLTAMRATLVDISPTACDMAFVNMVLHGIPAVVVQANTLTMEVWKWWHTAFWPLARGGVTTRESLARNPLLEPVVKLEFSPHSPFFGMEAV